MEGPNLPEVWCDTTAVNYTVIWAEADVRRHWKKHALLVPTSSGTGSNRLIDEHEGRRSGLVRHFSGKSERPSSDE